MSPLHSLQSHYPYRDAPMTFFLTLALLECLLIASRPRLSAFLLVGLGGGLGVAIKASALAVLAPLAVGSGLAFLRSPRQRPVVAGGTLAAALLAALPVMLRVWGQAPEGLAWGFTLAERYVGEQGRTVSLLSLIEVGPVLVHWLGIPFLVAVAAGLGYGVWRRRGADLVLLASSSPPLRSRPPTGFRATWDRMSGTSSFSCRLRRSWWAAWSRRRGGSRLSGPAAGRPWRCWWRPCW